MFRLLLPVALLAFALCGKSDLGRIYFCALSQVSPFLSDSMLNISHWLSPAVKIEL